MELGIEFLQINRLIIHKIIEREPAQPSATYELEDELIDLGNAKDTLYNRIIQACGKESHSFIMDIGQIGGDTFFEYATNIDNDVSFIESSKNIAILLATKQTRMGIQGGYLLVLDGINRLTKRKIIIVIKADFQEVLKHSKDGTTTKLEVLEQVFLSPASKLFKIGILAELLEITSNNPKDVRNYTALLFDSQFNADAKPAEYFYKNFLGFSIEKNNKIQSQRLFDNTEKFIKDKINDFEKQSELLSYLKQVFLVDKTPTIQPSRFAEMLFDDAELLSSYTEDIVSNLPYSIVKDSTLLQARLKKRNINFKNDIKLTGPEQKFDTSVTVITKTDDLKPSDFDGTFTIIKIAGKPYQNESKRGRNN